ncbi:DgyrCDS8857 [Dimorphilus gyrociliatus]|uniref:DgyrCDS8857 n=1 Tax=Dimorphilus gyrociliatus TaxID=2664684 RepID=A0A7I8VVB0_9ANNE|nr:DgyrCDS8857 [Dimorphilus gyrociliatus]
MSSYSLTDFDSEGRGDVARWFFAMNLIPFHDNRISLNSWYCNSKLAENTPFGKLPVLEIDGLKICQSKAIGRLLAKRYGYYGRNDLEQARIDMVVDCIADVMDRGLHIFFYMDEGSKKQKELKDFIETTLPEGVACLSNILDENQYGTGFVGETLTWADYEFASQFSWLEIAGHVVNLPSNLRNLMNTVLNIPQIKEYRENYAKRSQHLQQVMSSYKLYYFDFPGRAEVIRWQFLLAKVPFEEERIPKEKWADLKPKYLSDLPFGQLPLLEVDGKKLCQSGAINRMLAKKFGNYGKNIEEETRIDMVIGCMSDVIEPAVVIYIRNKDSPDFEKKAADYENRVLPEGLAKLEKLLEQNNEGIGFVGKDITWADLELVVQTGWCKSINLKPNFPPRIQKLREHVLQIPEIAAYVAKYDK